LLTLALGIASFYSTEWPLLIISPASLLISWEESVKKWLPRLGEDQTAIAFNREQLLVAAAVYIISYDMVTKLLDFLKYKNFKVIIAVVIR
jgi:SWI/SNF-related matrix-associated actin-dependent regulator 1 of chromatin subfamily A